MAMGLVASAASLSVGARRAQTGRQTSMRTVHHTPSLIPMFLLMGTFVSNSGMSASCSAPQRLRGHLRAGWELRRRARRLCRHLRLVGGDRCDVLP